MTCYPVIIPTLNRFTHFKNCVESLSRCKLANETELIIGLDFPAKESHKEGHDKIADYISTISGFKKVTIIKREKNFGAANNYLDLKNYALSYNDCVIATEDDNIFAPTFLEYMNSALYTLKDNESIESVSGYNAPQFYTDSSHGILTLDSSAWGTGTWKYKEMGWERSREYAQSILSSLRKSWKIYITYPCLLSMICQMYQKKEIYGDALRTARNILENRFQLKPSVSLVRNMGHDGTGLHSGLSSKIDFHQQVISDKEDFIINSKSKLVKAPWNSLIFYGFPNTKLVALKGIVSIWIKYFIRYCQGQYKAI